MLFKKCVVRDKTKYIRMRWPDKINRCTDLCQRGGNKLDTTCDVCVYIKDYFLDYDISETYTYVLN